MLMTPGMEKPGNPTSGANGTLSPHCIPFFEVRSSLHGAFRASVWHGLIFHNPCLQHNISAFTLALSPKKGIPTWLAQMVSRRSPAHDALHSRTHSKRCFLAMSSDAHFSRSCSCSFKSARYGQRSRLLLASCKAQSGSVQKLLLCSLV